jgi:proline iminopeptidase
MSRARSLGLFPAALAACASLAGCADRGPDLSPHEGFLEVPGGRVWYRIAGTGAGTPLVLLHGGPGVTSHYMNPLAALGDERPVIFYDQLGSGRSTRTTDSTRWTIAHFVAELDSVRRALGLREVHLLGHSWGTMLATQYVLAHPNAGVKSLILASPALSTARWVADADSLLTTLPDSVQQVIGRHEAAGTFDAPEYQDAVMAFYSVYLWRGEPGPDIDSAFAGMNADIYGYMWGPSEFTATGTLQDFDVTDSLALIDIPTLFTTGEYDEALPSTVQWYAGLMPNAELAIIPGAAHLTMQDEPEENVRLVREFLRRMDESERP